MTDNRKKDPYARGSGVPNPVDVHVGSRLRQRRSLAGISQTSLADTLNLTFQQIQKYERGANRISASRLYQLSQILDVPVSYFFEKLGGLQTTSTKPQMAFADNKQAAFINEDVFHEKETLDLLRAYYSVTDSRIRKDILNIVKTMAQNLSSSK